MSAVRQKEQETEGMPLKGSCIVSSSQLLLYSAKILHAKYLIVILLIPCMLLLSEEWLENISNIRIWNKSSYRWNARNLLVLGVYQKRGAGKRWLPSYPQSRSMIPCSFGGDSSGEEVYWEEKKPRGIKGKKELKTERKTTRTRKRGVKKQLDSRR